MIMKKFSVLLVFVLVLNSFLFTPVSNAATVRHVGPGQTYNGTSSAVIQQAINAASSGDTIYLHQATYNISGPIVLKSGLTLKGDGINKTIIYGASNVCTTSTQDAYVMCKNVSNVEIYGITFKSASVGPSDNGHGALYRNCITARDSSHITVHDCSAPKWTYLDFFKGSKSNNLKMYNCDVVTGHAAGYFFKCVTVEAYNNRILVYTNAGLRGDGSTNQVFHHNTIWSEAASGQAAFEFQNNCNNTEMHHNLVYDFNFTKPKYRFVTQNYDNSAYGSVSFHDNVYWNSSGGVQIGTGTGNIVNPSNHTVSYWENQGYGCGLGSGGGEPPVDPNAWYSGTNFSSQKTLGTGNTGTNVTIEFDVTPLYSNSSGVIGYADTSTTINSFSSMAMVLSMEADKYFYARNGGSYAKDANVSFSANNTYHIKIVANMSAKTYDVFVKPTGGSQIQIANDYAFRTGSPVTDDVGKVCLNSATTNNNDFKINNHTVSTGTTVTWYSGTNFSSQKTLGTGNTGTRTIEFDVTPLYSNSYGIIGYADTSTTINSFSSMAIVLCMESDKYFYARNGGSYAKDANVSYSANNTYHIKIVANMSAKTYDVFVKPTGGSQIQIANDYAFRTGSPVTDDVGKVCLNSATTNNNDFKVTNHMVY